MSPPTEQVIRDYLNRLSVAARGRLGAEDRRALVTRTREFIDRNSSISGAATSMEVAALLARLGDPGVLVDQEVARLAAARGEAVEPPAARGGRLGAALRRRNAQASWHWPQVTGSQAMQARLLNGTGPAPGADTAGTGSQPAQAPPRSGDRQIQPRSGDRQIQPRSGEGPDAQGSDAGRGGSAMPPIRIPAQRGRTAPGAPATDQISGAGTGPGPDPALLQPTWPSVVARSATTAAAPADSDAPAGAAPGSTDSVPTASASVGQPDSGGRRRALLPGGVRPAGRIAPGGVGLAKRISAWARGSPVEAIAVTLLGIGGACYPPVWILGAGFALMSRLWDYRDKWIGLAGPVVLLVVGTGMAVSVVTHHGSIGHDVHEGWVYADILSRIGAVAGTSYLVWRLTHPRRPPAVPPWTKPRKVT